MLEGAECLRSGDLESLGDAMKRSHLSSRDLYEVTVPELDLLAETAWSVEGCWGARLAGGGFGGCVLSLVHADAIDALESRLRARYLEEYSREPFFLRTAIAGGAESFSDDR